MVEFGKTPRVEAARLKKWGFDIAIYPGLGFSVAAEAMRQAWEHLKDKGTSNGMNVPQFSGMHELMGFPEVWDFEKKWASVNGKQFLEMLARLPARVWLQAILGLIGFVVLAVLGFAVIAGVAAIIVVDPVLYGAGRGSAACSSAGRCRSRRRAPGPQGDRRARTRSSTGGTTAALAKKPGWVSTWNASRGKATRGGKRKGKKSNKKTRWVIFWRKRKDEDKNEALKEARLERHEEVAVGCGRKKEK